MNNCNVLNCGGGNCIHSLLEEYCPICGSPLIEVSTTGFRFCSNDISVCDYEDESHIAKKPGTWWVQVYGKKAQTSD